MTRSQEIIESTSWAMNWQSELAKDLRCQHEIFAIDEHGHRGPIARVYGGPDEKNVPLICAALDMLSELRAAHEIIAVMLNAMTTQQKFMVAKNLELRGISPDGMTRAHERDAVIKAALGESMEGAQS